MSNSYDTGSLKGSFWIRISSTAILACLLPSIAPQAHAETCPTGRESLLAQWRKYTATACTDLQELRPGEAVKRWTAPAGGWSLPLERLAEVLDDTPNITIPSFRTDLVGRSAALLATHGKANGGMAAQYFLNGSAQITAYNSLTAAPPTGLGYSVTEVHLGTVDDTPCFYGNPVIGIEPTGIYNKFRTMGSNAMIDGEYCYSAQAATSWNAVSFAGYMTEIDYSTSCKNQEKLWSRIGCYPWLGNHELAEAVRGAWGSLGALEGLEVYGVPDWVFSCDVSCKDLATTFVEVGAFADTVYCQTASESATTSISLRGYSSWSDYPEHPTTIVTKASQGGYGLFARYVHILTGSFALFDWLEEDDYGGNTRSEPFLVTSVRPDGWAEYFTSGITDMEPPSASEYVSVPEDTTSAIYSFGSCSGNAILAADIIVYSSADSLATPVFNRIVTDNPSKRVKKFIGSDVTAQACTNVLAAVWNANRYENTYCEPAVPFPINPGPEVYIAGGTGIVLPASLADSYNRCGHPNCQSDYLLYNVAGTGIPVGPLSRVPVKTVAQAEKAATYAHEFTIGENVDAGHAIVVAGDGTAGVDTTFVPAEALSTVVSGYEQIGMAVRPILRSHDFVRQGSGYYTAKFDAFRAEANSGVREVFGFGGYTGSNSTPGIFFSGCYYPLSSLSLKQRFITWLPGCNIHNTWSTNPVCDVAHDGSSGIRNLMFNDPNNSCIAASVGHMDGGWEHQHRAMVQYLLDARLAAAHSSPPKSVSEIAYNALVAATSEKPWLGDYALSMSVWGSYTKIPTSAGSGVDAVLDMAGDGVRLRSVAVGDRNSKLILSLPSMAVVGVGIYDVEGRLVRSMRLGQLTPGDHLLHWDTKDERGVGVSSGIYFVRADVENGGHTRYVSTRVIVL